MRILAQYSTILIGFDPSPLVLPSFLLSLPLPAVEPSPSIFLVLFSPIFCTFFLFRGLPLPFHLPLSSSSSPSNRRTFTNYISRPILTHIILPFLSIPRTTPPISPSPFDFPFPLPIVELTPVISISRPILTHIFLTYHSIPRTTSPISPSLFFFLFPFQS